MTKDEYNDLTGERSLLVKVSELKNKSDRTLLYGYTRERNTIHVYLRDGFINVFRYTYNKDELWYDVGKQIKLDSYLIPNKRLYPECCDKEFCELIFSKGIELSMSFTTFNEKRENKVFYGDTI